MNAWADQPSLRDRFVGCLLGLAVGEALGAPFEGLPAEFILWHSGSVPDLLARPLVEPLRYTDDTQMMIGVAETLVDCGEVRADVLLSRLAANYEPDRGYGTGARQLLEATAARADVDALAESVFPGGSFGNGAAMRVAPVGLYFHHDLSHVAEQAVVSARPTHRHSLGVEGARLMALATALAVRGPPLDRRGFYWELARDCREEEFRWQLRAARHLRFGDSLAFLGNGLPAHRSVVTAVACFTTCPTSFERCVESAISLGDDTDTLAAMAGALSGAYLGICGVPSRFADALESGPKGGGYVRRLAEALYDRHVRLARTGPEN
jgi:poly(ADP-ribose) glycohydrolase ARH3